MLLALVMRVAQEQLLKRRRLGVAIRATAQDRDAAQQMGISVGALQRVTFALASGLGV